MEERTYIERKFAQIKLEIMDVWDRHWMDGTYGRCVLEVDNIRENVTQ